jgi:hypothetical protein
MIKDMMDLVHQSHDIFAASHLPFPDFLSGTASQVQPCQGVVDMDLAQPGPSSISQLNLQCHIAGYFSFLKFLHCQRPWLQRFHS